MAIVRVYVFRASIPLTEKGSQIWIEDREDYGRAGSKYRIRYDHLASSPHFFSTSTEVPMSEDHTAIETNPPRLPADLECRIFTTSASANQTTIASLLLVARRVREWIEPLRFRCLVFGVPSSSYQFASPAKYNLLASKTPSFLATHTKSFLIRGSIVYDDYNKIFSLLVSSSFRGLTELAFWIDGGDLPGPWSFPHLRRLSFNVIHIFSFYDVLQKHPSQTLGITHLKLVFSAISELPGLTPQLPALSHIQTTWMGSDEGHDALQKLLELNQIVVVIIEAHSSQRGFHTRWPILLHPKIVYSDVNDWESEWRAQATGQPDFWEKAEAERADSQEERI
ncbi:hypothetical protein DL96DRAFT_1717540 [Flagelloscypha sp. PMI_526]|nr:hypothetical protein DL96DRAFT_1717540 [Flagelloscypha sp. PMI_526]